MTDELRENHDDPTGLTPDFMSDQESQERFQALKDRIKAKIQTLNDSGSPKEAKMELYGKFNTGEGPKFICSYLIPDEEPELEDIGQKHGGGAYHIRMRIGNQFAGSAAIRIAEEVYGPMKRPFTDTGRLPDGKTLAETEELKRQNAELRARIEQTEKEAQARETNDKIDRLEKLILDMKNNGNGNKSLFDRDIAELEKFKTIFGSGNSGEAQLQFMGEMMKQVVEVTTKIKDAPTKDVDTILASFLESALDKFKNTKPEDIGKGVRNMVANPKKDLVEIATDFLKQIHIGYEINANEQYADKVIESKPEYAQLKNLLATFETSMIISIISKQGASMAEIQDAAFMAYLERMINHLKKKPELTPDAGPAAQDHAGQGAELIDGHLKGETVDDIKKSAEQIKAGGKNGNEPRIDGDNDKSGISKGNRRRHNRRPGRTGRNGKLHKKVQDGNKADKPANVRHDSKGRVRHKGVHAGAVKVSRRSAVSGKPGPTGSNL